MNDDELMTAVRESFADVRSVTELDRIVGRSHAVRTRRRVTVVAGGLGAAATAGVAVAVSVAMPASLPVAGLPAPSHLAASHPASRPSVQLAAWTVTRQADGTIRVTFREATDPAGLQRTLRADGVPASVTFTGQQNPACRSINFPAPPFSDKGAFRGPLTKVLGFGGLANAAYGYPRDALVIRPSALRHGDGIQIWTSGTPGAADNFQLHADPVHASPQCTGS